MSKRIQTGPVLVALAYGAGDRQESRVPSLSMIGKPAGQGRRGAASFGKSGQMRMVAALGPSHLESGGRLIRSCAGELG